MTGGNEGGEGIRPQGLMTGFPTECCNKDPWVR